MGIFVKRPLAAALFSFIASMTAVYLLAASDILFRNATLFCVLLFVLLLLVLAAIAALVVFSIRVPRLRLRLVTYALTISALLPGLLLSSGMIAYAYAPAERLVGERARVTAELLERESVAAGYARYRAEVSSVLLDGEEVSIGTFRAILVLDATATYSVGDRITVDASCGDLSEIYRDPSYALSDGYLVGFICEEGTDAVVSVEETDAKIPLTGLARELRDRLSFRLSEGLGGEVGAFASAVLLGDKSGLSDETVRDFGRAGVSHILALSGLHMSVLIGGFALFLRRLGLHRRIVSCLTIVMILGFLLLTGFSESACRAGLMLGFAALLGFFSRSPDPVTSLFLAVSLLLLVYPCAVFSKGLWMSFSSVLGLILLMPRINAHFRVSRREKRGLYPCRRLLAALTVSALVTVVATFSVLPALYLFGFELSLYGVVTNLLTVFLMPPVLVLSVAYLFCGRVVLIGAVTRTLLEWIVGWILGAARTVSQLPNATVSLSYSFVPAVLLTFLLPTVFLLCVPPQFLAFCRMRLLRRRGTRGASAAEGAASTLRLRWLAVPPLLAVLLYAVCLPICLTSRSASDRLSVSVLSGSGGELLTVRDGVSAVLVDLSEGYCADYSVAADEAAENGCPEWSRLVLTECRLRHVSSIPHFCSQNLVREVLLPTPDTPSETLYTEALLERLEHGGIAYAFYERGAETRVTDSLTLTLSAFTYLERSQRPIFLLTLAGKERLVYLTQAIEESALRDAACEEAGRADVVVYGTAGPIRFETVELSSGDNTRQILLYGEENQTKTTVDEALLARLDLRCDAKRVRLWESD